MKVMFAAIGSEILSLEALSAALKQYGHSCALAFDRGMFDDKQYFTVPKLARLFNDRKQVLHDIAAYKPDLLAFSVFADNFQWCLSIAREAKEICKAPIIFGGVHPTSVPEVCLAEDCVDIVCLGEGENAIVELADSLQHGQIDYSIANLWFKKEGSIIRNTLRPVVRNLDTLPIIDKELFRKFIPLKKYYLTVTNRGCIAACSYCSQNFYQQWQNKNNLGPFYRERSVENVIAELLIMKKQYKIERVDIKNNVLAASAEWTLEFCQRYKNVVGLPLRVMGHPRTITPETAQALKASGCWHVQLGVESLNPVVRRDVLGRTETNTDILAAIDAMELAGLGYSVDLMVGLPGETETDIRMALETFAGKKHLIRASIFWLEYLPAVAITESALAAGLLDKQDLDKINRGMQANYLSTGSVTNRHRRKCLLSYQLLFRIVPVAPRWVIRLVLRSGVYRLFKFLPQIMLIIIVDITVSIVKKDHWALYAMYSYVWEIKRRLLRKLGVGA